MRQRTFLSFVLVLFLASFGHANPLFETADAAYKARLDLAQCEKSLTLYEKILAEEPDSVEAHWKAARSVWWLADQNTKRKEKLTLFQKGTDLAERAVELDNDSVEAHFWLGANLGSFGETKGVLKSLFLVPKLKKEMAEINRINPKFEGGAGYRVLGIMDYKVPRFAGGSKKRAEERLLKCFEIDATNPFTNYYLAEYYSVVKKWDKAKEALARLEALTENEVDLADLRLMQKKGQALREKKLKNR